MRRGEPSQFVLYHPIVMRDRYLVDHVILLVRGRCEDMPYLTRRQPSQLGHVVFDDEMATGVQVPLRVPECLDLFSLAGQVGVGVAKQVHKRELLVD